MNKGSGFHNSERYNAPAGSSFHNVSRDGKNDSLSFSKSPQRYKQPQKADGNQILFSSKTKSLRSEKFLTSEYESSLYELRSQLTKCHSVGSNVDHKALLAIKKLNELDSLITRILRNAEKKISKTSRYCVDDWSPELKINYRQKRYLKQKIKKCD